jgi:hypothetical protein
MKTLGWCLLLLAVAALPLQAQDTILRHDNYLAFTGAPGATADFAVRSIARAPYHDDLKLLALDSQSQEIFDQVLPVGTQTQLTVPLATGGLHVLCVSSGQPLAVVRRTNGPFALVAWEQTPLNLCGAFAKHYFLVPRGVSKFDLGLSADVTGEGAHVAIMTPEGKPAVELEDDFDTLQRIKVEVPAGLDGQPWALTITKPQDPKLVLDDVLLWLGRGLPPYLCEQPEWLGEFVGTARPEQISLQVPLKNMSLTNGGTQTVKFTLPAAPQTKMAALRAVAQDVDYLHEGTFTLNGSKPYAFPLTGDGGSLLVTVMVKPEDLRVGENVLEFRHDSRASSAMGLTQMEIIAGEMIYAEESW